MRMRNKREAERLDNLAQAIEFPTAAAEGFETFTRNVADLIRENLHHTYRHNFELEWCPHDSTWFLTASGAVHTVFDEYDMPGVQISRTARAAEDLRVEELIEIAQQLVDALNQDAKLITKAYIRQDVEKNSA